MKSNRLAHVVVITFRGNQQEWNSNRSGDKSKLTWLGNMNYKVTHRAPMQNLELK